jgi:hypothetical protein
MVKRICLHLGAQVQLKNSQLDVLPATLTIYDDRGIEERLSSYLLPPPEDLCKSFQAWQKYISPHTPTSRKIRVESLEIEDLDLEIDGNINLELLAQNFKQDLNTWLNVRGWLNQDGQLDFKIKKALKRNSPERKWHQDEIQIFIETEDKRLRSFPWQEWDTFANYCLNNPGTEVSISATDFRRPEQQHKPQLSALVRILAVFGDDRLDLTQERQLIANLRKYGGDVSILHQPDCDILTAHLHDPGSWHIFCFAGHSGSDATGQIGWLEIQPGIRFPITELTDLLADVVRDKLQLAIFNSCDGLGLANSLTSLSLPYCIVMRESVDSFFARRLLQHLLTAFIAGKSLFAAMYITRTKLREEFDEAGKQPGKSWLPVIVANPEAKPLTWDGLFTDRRLAPKWELLLGFIALIAVFGLPLSILWEFHSFETLKLYAQLYPQIVIYPSLLLWIGIYAVYRAICLTRQKPRLFWGLTLTTCAIGWMSVILDLYTDPLMLLELAPNAVVSIAKENLVNIATSHHFSLDLLSKIPKQVFDIDRVIKSDGQFVFKKSEIESSIHNFIYLSPSVRSTNIYQNYHGFLRVALSAQLWQNGFNHSSLSRWFYEFTHFGIFFCGIETFVLTVSTILMPTSIFKKHRYLTYLIVAQLSGLAWTPFYLYYISKIKVTLFAPQFDPRLSNTIGLFYVVALTMSLMTIYLVLRQTNTIAYRYILITVFVLGVAVAILMSTWGISIFDRMFGIGSGSVFITWLAAIPTLILFFIPTVYAIDNRIGEK